MRKLAFYLVAGLFLATIATACVDKLDVQQVYGFDLVTMPIQKKIAQDETAELRCQLVKEGNYSQARFFIRYFQVEGKGELRLDIGTVFKPNDLYPLERENFRLYYTSHSADQQVIDVYIEDNNGQVVKKTFSFQNENGDKIEP